MTAVQKSISILTPDEDDNTIMDKVKDGLEELRLFCNVGAGTISESQTEDKDWINNWKQYWHTFTIGDLYIKPTWEPLTEEMKGHAILSIDPVRHSVRVLTKRPVW